MAYQGRARVSWRRPEAMGECDVCGFWHSLSDMKRQMQWSGNKLIDTGYLVGNDCLDVPQEQFRTPILPPDPVPRMNPRPSPSVTPIVYAGGPITTTPSNQGFSQYVLEPGYINPDPTFQRTQSGVLAGVATISGVPTPGLNELVSYVVPMQGNATVTLVPANSIRTFLLVFNPTQTPAQISFGQAVQGGVNNLSIGPNEAYFWSTAQGLAPVYVGALTAIGLFPGLPLWAWEDNSNLLNLTDDGGVLSLAAADPAYPTSPVGLPIGAIWNNGLLVSVVPGTTPNPTAPPIFFGSVTAASLLATTGANLPNSDPFSLNQLWNNNGVVSISFGPPFMTDDQGNVITDDQGNPIRVS